MSYADSTSTTALNGAWQEDAQAAITANPRYFVWWYTAKSLALVGALGWVAYLLGKEAGRKERRGSGA